MSAGGGSEATVTARTRYGWAKPKECGEQLNGRKPSLKLEGIAYKSNVRPAIVSGCEAWCLTESRTGTLQSGERSMVRATYGVQVNQRSKKI